MSKKQPAGPEKASLSLRDLSAVGAFIGAISVLLLVASYVIFRVSSERAYREKWKDYNDCGWA